MKAARIPECCLHKNINHMLPNMEETQTSQACGIYLSVVRYRMMPCGGWMVVSCNSVIAANDLFSQSPLYPRPAA